MNKKELRKAIKEIFPEAKIKFIYDIAQITNWREMENTMRDTLENVIFTEKLEMQD